MSRCTVFHLEYQSSTLFSQTLSCTDFLCMLKYLPAISYCSFVRTQEIQYVSYKNYWEFNSFICQIQTLSNLQFFSPFSLYLNETYWKFTFLFWTLSKYLEYSHYWCFARSFILFEINFNIYYVNSLWDSKGIFEYFIELKYSSESNKLYSSMFNLPVSENARNSRILPKLFYFKLLNMYIYFIS